MDGHPAATESWWTAISAVAALASDGAIGAADEDALVDAAVAADRGCSYSPGTTAWGSVWGCCSPLRGG